jgi:hypothetical protein
MKRKPEPPCDHWDDLVGTVSAGDLKKGPFEGVATCRDCINKSAGYVTLVTGIVADPFYPYPEHRGGTAHE